MSTAVHIVIFMAAFLTAYFLRFDFEIPTAERPTMWVGLLFVVALKTSVFCFFGTYHHSWRYVMFSDMISLVIASSLCMTLIAFSTLLPTVQHIPRSVVLLDWIVSISMLAGVRAVWRFYHERDMNKKSTRTALVVGDRHDASYLVQHVQSQPDLSYRITGFVDIKSLSHGLRIGGVQVFGFDRIDRVLENNTPEEILIVASSVTPKVVRKVNSLAKSVGIPVKAVPSISQLIHGANPRDLELEDLLGRAEVKLDTAAIADLLEGRVVLVSGAGGSIGSEICRQVMRFNPSRIILVERNEFNLFQVERTLEGSKVDVVPCIADILNVKRLREVFSTHRPHVVFHAAAYKHVPMMESNPREAIKNNVFGTKRIADMASEYGVKSFVLISTDKAVNPESTMGATKNLAEKYVRSLSDESSTMYVSVRFGNVLGSTGSVVPLFQEQIRNGGPLTVTHPDMERFFMTIPEASQLVLQAAAMGRGEEVFVLDMGQPVKILDLAHDMIRLAGLHESDIEIRYTGLRPGEKLTEELYTDQEITDVTTHDKILVTYNHPESLDHVRKCLVELLYSMRESESASKETLFRLVSDESSVPESVVFNA